MTEPKEEFGWLIEVAEQTPGGPVYFAGLTDTGERLRGSSVFPEWSTDNLLAVRFARKEDADRAAKGIAGGTLTRVVEHGWG